MKRQYETPELVVLGDITEMTQGFRWGRWRGRTRRRGWPGKRNPWKGWGVSG